MFSLLFTNTHTGFYNAELIQENWATTEKENHTCTCKFYEWTWCLRFYIYGQAWIQFGKQGHAFKIWEMNKAHC